MINQLNLHKSTKASDGPTEGKELPLDRFLTYRLSQTHMALNRQAVSILRRVSGLGLNEWRVLAMVASGWADSNTGLSSITGLDKSIISRSMGALESSGLIKLSRNREDRRKVDMVVTAAGRALYLKTVPHMRARQRYLLSRLNKNERAVIYRALEKIEAAAGARNFSDV